MGEMADYYLEQDMMRRGVIERHKKQQKQITWTSNDGTVRIPSEMEDLHLLNCLHLCEKREGYEGEDFLNNSPTYRAMVDELILRGRITKEYYGLSLHMRKLIKF